MCQRFLELSAVSHMESIHGCLVKPSRRSSGANNLGFSDILNGSYGESRRRSSGEKILVSSKPSEY